MSKESAPYNVVQPLTDAELLPIQQRQRIAQSLADFSGEAGQTEWYALDVGRLLATIEALKKELAEKDTSPGMVTITIEDARECAASLFCTEEAVRKTARLEKRRKHSELAEHATKHAERLAAVRERVDRAEDQATATNSEDRTT